MAKKVYVGVGNFEKRNLPNGYTQVEYIESSGTQYIDTGVKPNQNTRVTIDIRYVTTPTSEAAVFGCRNNNTEQYWVRYKPNSNGFCYRYNEDTNNYTIEKTSTTKLSITVHGNVFQINESSVSAPSGNMQSQYNLFLLAINNAGNVQYQASACVYSCKIYDSDVLIRDFVPCTNLSGIVGLYDVQNNVFYQNSGTGTFSSSETVYQSYARQVKKIYLGIDNVARKVKKGYVGVEGIARPFYSREGKLVYYGTITPLSVERYYAAGASNPNYALFAGGYSAIDSVETYNKSLVRGDAPTLYEGVYFLAGASIGDYALFAGGTKGNTRSSKVNSYDSSLVKTNPSDLSIYGIYNSAGASNPNYALFAGGNISTSHVAFVAAYDKTLVKTEPTGLTEFVSELAGASVGDYALFAGGINNSSAVVSTVNAYNSQLVKTNPTSLPSELRDQTGASVGDYALFAGGYESLDTTTSVRVTAYNKNLVRSNAPNLTSSLWNMSGASIDDYALFAGGMSPFTYTYSNQVTSYNANLVKTIQTNLSAGKAYALGASIGDYALFAGGMGSSSAYKSVDAYMVD